MIKNLIDGAEGYFEQGVCRDPMTAVMIGMSVVSGIQQGNAAEAQAEAAADADRYNAEIAQQNAQIIGQQTDAAVDKQDRERRLRMGAARAGAGASGIGAESFGDVLQSSAAAEELDLLTLKSEGLLRQRELTTQSTLLEHSAKSKIAGGKASKTAAIIGGVSKGLGAASDAGAFSGGGKETWEGGQPFRTF